MRLFISINLNSETKDKLFSVQNELKQYISAKYPYSVKWENKNNFHLTLFFLGEFETDRLNSLIKLLSGVKSENKDGIILRSSGINAFPSLRSPRVLFVNIDDGKKVIENLYNKISKKLSEFDFIADKKFHAHITLGRIKYESGIRSIEIPENIEYGFSYNTVSFFLMQSTLTSLGAFHKVINEFKL